MEQEAAPLRKLERLYVSRTYFKNRPGESRVMKSHVMQCCLSGLLCRYRYHSRHCRCWTLHLASSAALSGEINVQLISGSRIEAKLPSKESCTRGSRPQRERWKFSFSLQKGMFQSIQYSVFLWQNLATNEVSRAAHAYCYFSGLPPESFLAPYYIGWQCSQAKTTVSFRSFSLSVSIYLCLSLSLSLSLCISLILFFSLVHSLSLSPLSPFPSL